MPDNPLTSEAEPEAAPTPSAAATDEAVPHDVAPPEPEPVAALESVEPPPAAVEEPPPPPPEPVAAAPPEPEPAPPEPPTPVAHVEEEPEEEALPEPAASEEPTAAESPTVVEEEPLSEPSNKHWYVVKVQSGREETIKEAIERRVKIERLEEFFGQIVIPVERVTEMRRGKRRGEGAQALSRIPDGGSRVQRPHPVPVPRDVGGGRFRGRHAEPAAAADVAARGGPYARRAEGPGEGRRARSRSRSRRWSAATASRCATAPSPAWRARSRRSWRRSTTCSVELTIFGRPVPVELEYWQVEPV